MAISLLLPVVSTRWPSSLDTAMLITPRTRDCRFSAGSPDSGKSPSPSRNASTIAWIGISPRVEALPLHQVLGVGHRVIRRPLARHQDHRTRSAARSRPPRSWRPAPSRSRRTARAAPTGTRSSARSPPCRAPARRTPRRGRRAAARTALASSSAPGPRPARSGGAAMSGSVTRSIVISVPSPASTASPEPDDCGSAPPAASARMSPESGTVPAPAAASAGGSSRSATISASSNCGPRASGSPVADTRIESPSKTSSSCPPTRLQYASAAPASRARRCTRSSRTSSLPRSYGDAFGTTSSDGARVPRHRHGAAVLPQVLADRDRDVDRLSRSPAPAAGTPAACCRARSSGTRRTRRSSAGGAWPR